MNAAQMHEAASLGALIEVDYRQALRSREQVEAMRVVGPRHVVLSEFLATTGNTEPLRYGGIASLPGFIRDMRGQGFTMRDLELMFKENPARLLGLPPLSSN